MKIRFFMAAAAALVALSSCGPIKYSSSDNVNLRSIREFAFIEPVADVLYYDRRNKPVYDADLSEEAADLITTIVSSQRYPFSRVIRMDYDRSDRDIRKWIQNIGSVSTSRLSRIRVPDDLLDAIERSGHRYGVVIFSSGYVRSREAILYEERQEAIGNALGAALDALLNSKKDKDKADDKDKNKNKSSYKPYSNPENKTPYDCNMYCVVIDTDKEEIIHYIHPLPFLEKDPLDGRDMETMLNRLLSDF